MHFSAKEEPPAQWEGRHNVRRHDSGRGTALTPSGSMQVQVLLRAAGATPAMWAGPSPRWSVQTEQRPRAGLDSAPLLLEQNLHIVTLRLRPV